MPISTKVGKVLGGILVTLVVMVLVLRTWVVPALIVSSIQGMVEGKVEVQSWWLNGRSAGVIGLTLHETPALKSAVVAKVPRVSTDLSIGRLLRGRFMPSRIELERPEILLRVHPSGQILNLPALKGSGDSLRLPAISTDAAKVVFRREGTSDEMVITRVTAQLRPDSAGRVLMVNGGTDDPTWGRWTASGRIEPEAHQGEIRLVGSRVEADPATLANVPFIPSEIWAHVVPRGPVGVEVRLDWATGRSPEFRTQTEVTLLGTSAQFPSLELAAAEASGTLRVEGRLVRVERVRGRAIGGEVSGGGSLDFDSKPPRINLDLGLAKIKVEETPLIWQLDKAGITGLLTGTVELRALLNESGVDLSGSTGTATVENASIQGIPVKSLRLAMRAQGTDLEYDTGSQARSGAWFAVPGLQLLQSMFVSRLVGESLVALQAPPVEPEPRPEPKADDVEPRAEEPRKFDIRLPKTVTTQIELEDVDVAELIAKAQFLAAFPFPIPVTGKLSLKAEATIPLGALQNVKLYRFHGDAKLKGASVFKVDFAQLTARLDLEDGRLDLKDLRGVLVDRPNGGPDNPPRAGDQEVPAEGPLPPGGFRGDLHAEISPPGQFSAKFEGYQLPLGELSAPMLARPTPLAGLASLNFEARADLAKAADPAAWTASGRAESLHVTYRTAVLERVVLDFQLKEGRLVVPSLTASMAGHPLTAQAEADLKPPMAYRFGLKVEDWDLSTILAFIPQVPQPSPVNGTLSAQAEATGALTPWTINTDGQGRFTRLVAGPLPLGEVPFRWSTDRDSILISDIGAQLFGGQLTAEAHIPLTGGGAAEGTAKLAAIDTAKLSEVIPGQSLKLTGIVDGSIAFVVPRDGRRVEAKLLVSSPDLTFQGIPAEQVRASIRTEQGDLKYEVTADSLGGKLKLQGQIPLTAAPPPPQSHVGDGEFRLVGFTLDQLWKSFKNGNAISRLSGEGAIDANIRNVLAGAGVGLWAHGNFELRNLKWDRREPVGQLKGVVAKTPTTWRVEPLNGELMGGSASGVAWGTLPSQETAEAGFNLRVERATLDRVLVLVPSLSPYITGLGTLQVSGTFAETLRAEVGINVGQGRIAGLPVSELQAPFSLTFNPSSGLGVVQTRQVTARLSGGRVRGDGSLRLGVDRSFQGQVQLTNIDLQTLNVFGSDARHPATGRISGQVTLSGPDPEQPERYRGRVTLDLDDAALFSIPIFREVEKFFGSARGGLFEDGDMIATIANRQLIIESFSLEGRLVQLHLTGTVGFDSQLNLEVLVNTSQLIPETGQALLALIPGLSSVLRRNDQAIAQVANFLSNRLVKLRVTGTLRNPTVAVDSSVLVAETAVAFFAGVLKLPLGFLR